MCNADVKPELPQRKYCYSFFQNTSDSKGLVRHCSGAGRSRMTDGETDLAHCSAAISVQDLDAAVVMALVEAAFADRP